MRKRNVSSYQQGVNKVGRINLSGLDDILVEGVGDGASIAGLTTMFNQNALEEEGFQKVIEAIHNVGTTVEYEDFNILKLFPDPENLLNVWDPSAGYKNKFDFSSVLDVYTVGLVEALVGDVVSSVLLAFGFYALAKDKESSSHLFGASTGAALYSAITSSQYASALAEMPFQIGGEDLVSYCSNHPNFAEPLKPLVYDLLFKLGVSKGVSIVLAVIAGGAFVYSVVKNLSKRVSDYKSDMLE